MSGSGSPRPAQIVIVGAGIVGAAVAMRLSQTRPGTRLLLIEKENEPAAHQTGHNSGVLHSGIYYAPGSLKARLCVSGKRKMIAFAQEHFVPYRICGKLIVATRPQETEQLQALWNNGVQNDVPDLEYCGRMRLRELEPSVGGVAAIYSPKTGVIDYRQVVAAMLEVFTERGGAVSTGTEVSSLLEADDGVTVRTNRGNYPASLLINCAGLQADRIARMTGMPTDVRLIPFRGEYHLIRQEKARQIRNLVYPVPDPRFPFLGVHFTRTIHGVAEAGPNAVLALAREGYRKTDVCFRDMVEMAAFGGFWKMAAKYWKMGLGEIYRSWARAGFAKALRRLLPEIETGDLQPGPSGVRAQCVTESGELVNDFKIVANRRSLHVINVPSPAATASLAIADHILETYEAFIEKNLSGGQAGS